GRLLREYTVLLDPPLYSPQAAASAPQAPVSAPRVTGAPRAPQAPAPVRTTLERSPREALSQVQAQNQSWRGSRNPAAGSAGARQLDATQRNAAGSAPSK
ncbi:peptigoglycan-binding protein LysM, partial [Escherichia coli]